MAGEPVWGGQKLLATDLGEDWEYQGTDGGTNSYGHAEAEGNNGDVIAENTHSGHETFNETYIYNGDATDYGTATTGALDASDALPGKYQTTANAVILAVAIDYSPCAKGQRERVTFECSRGMTADGAVYKPSLTTALKTKQENDGVPALFSNSATGSKCIDAKYRLECQEGRDVGADGTYLCGSNYKGQEQVNAKYKGKPALTTTGWQVDADLGDGSGSNIGYDEYNLSAKKAVLRTA